MDDPSRFTSINEYYTFIYAISYMMLVELGIWIYNFKGWLKRPDKKNNDYGTILIVMLIVPKPPKENEDEEQKLIKFRSDLGQSYIAAFAMGFPGVKGVDKAKHYKVNKVYYTQNLMDEPEELDDEDE